MSGENTLEFLDQPVEQPVGDKPVVETTVVEPKEPVVVDPALPAAIAPAADKVVPLATFLDMRDENKALKEKLKAREPIAPEGFTPPDPATDPVGYIHYREGLTELNIVNERMNISEKFAVKEHGKDLVDKARDWALERFAADPGYENKILGLSDPYDAVISDYNNHMLLQELTPAEVKRYREWKAAEALKQQPNGEGAAPAAEKVIAKPAASAAQQPAAKPAVPKSIAGRPASGGGVQAIPVGAGQAFDSLFEQR